MTVNLFIAEKNQQDCKSARYVPIRYLTKNRQIKSNIQTNILNILNFIVVMAVLEVIKFTRLFCSP